MQGILSPVRIAVVGATGNVGQEFLNMLHARGVPAGQVCALASSRSVGHRVRYGSDTLLVQATDGFDFSSCHLALFSPGAAVSAVYAPKAAAQGCWVVDNTSYFRMDPDVPLIIPELNLGALRQASRRIIANPNCSTIQMLLALAPIDPLYTLVRIVVATYQAVSGAGRRGVHELEQQMRVQPGTLHEEPSCFAKPIAANVIPQIDVFLADGRTKEEWKMAVETHKILGKPIEVSATCVRVPVYNGHSEAIDIECAEAVDLTCVYQALRDAPGLRVEQPGSEVFYSPQDVTGDDRVFISRLRQTGRANCLQMWVVADNLRKGAALNAIQIAEGLVKERMVNL